MLKYRQLKKPQTDNIQNIQEDYTVYILWNGNRKNRFETLEDATKAANEIARKTGIILTITKENKRNPRRIA